MDNHIQHIKKYRRVGDWIEKVSLEHIKKHQKLIEKKYEPSVIGVIGDDGGNGGVPEEEYEI